MLDLFQNYLSGHKYDLLTYHTNNSFPYVIKNRNYLFFYQFQNKTIQTKTNSILS